MFLVDWILGFINNCVDVGLIFINFFTGKNEMEEFLASHDLPSLSGSQRDKKKFIFKNQAFQ